MDSIEDFLNKSFALLEKNDKKSRGRRLSSISIDGNLKKIQKKEIEKEKVEKVSISFKNVITSDILYLKSKIIHEEKGNNQSLKKYFPSETVFNQEINEKKSFLIDKYLQNKCIFKKKSENKKKNKIVSDKFSEVVSLVKNDKSIKYIDVLPLNQIWLKYISGLLINDHKDDTFRIINLTLNEGLLKKNYEGYHSKLLRADYHGAYLIVYNSRNSNNIGIKGIVILETKNSFLIITIKNEIKTIIKDGAIFKIPLFDCLLLNEEEVINKDESLYIYINGSGFLYKATERTKAKFKK